MIIIVGMMMRAYNIIYMLRCAERYVFLILMACKQRSVPTS